MNISYLKKQTLWHVVLVDFVLLVAACCVPTLSHLLAVPLYQLSPMLLILLAGMLLVRDHRNAYILAVLLPWVSMLAVGMPTMPKAFCMTAEFVVVVFVASKLLPLAKRFVGSLGVMVSAILCGKMVYYLLKALIIAPAVLVTTPIYIQALSVLGAALLFAAFNRRLGEF